MFFILWIAVGLMTVIATGEDVANYGKPNTGAPVLQQQHNTNSIKGQSAQPGLDFQNIFSAYFDQMRKFQEQFANNGQLYAFTMNNPNSEARAQSSLTYNNGINGIDNGGRIGDGAWNGIQMAQQQAMAGIPNFSGGLPQNNFGQGAFASASVGPDGSYHSAGVFPENPNNPNVINRHNPASTQPGQGNFYGVASSSFSSASDVNGQKTETREAQTTTNDNRKITTYRIIAVGKKSKEPKLTTMETPKGTSAQDIEETAKALIAKYVPGDSAVAANILRQQSKRIAQGMDGGSRP